MNNESIIVSSAAFQVINDGLAEFRNSVAGAHQVMLNQKSVLAKNWTGRMSDLAIKEAEESINKLLEVKERICAGIRFIDMANDAYSETDTKISQSADGIN